MSLPHLFTGFLAAGSPLVEAFPTSMIPLRHPTTNHVMLDGQSGTSEVYFLATVGLKPETKDKLAALMERLGQGPAAEARRWLDDNPDLPIRVQNIAGVGMPLAAFI